MNTFDPKHYKKTKRRLFWLKCKLFFFQHMALKTYWSILVFMLLVAGLNLYFAIDSIITKCRLQKEYAVAIQAAEDAIEIADSLSNESTMLTQAAKDAIAEADSIKNVYWELIERYD